LETIYKRTKKFAFSGGEPLLVPYLPELAKCAKEMGFESIGLNTNGHLLTQSKFDQLQPNIDKITFSLDTLDDDTNRMLGRGKKHAGIILDRVKMVQNGDINPKITSVVTRPTIGDLETLGMCLEYSGVKKWKLLQFLQNNESNADLTISDDEFQNAADDLKNKFPDLDITAKKADYFNKKYAIVTPDGYFRTFFSSPIEQEELITQWMND
jgi:radical S-adenosyl methionine domain-containing protein 2